MSKRFSKWTSVTTIAKQITELGRVGYIDIFFYLCFLASIEEEEPRLEHAPQLGPPLDAAPDLKPVGEDDDALVLEGGKQLPLHAFLLAGVTFALGLQLNKE